MSASTNWLSALLASMCVVGCSADVLSPTEIDDLVRGDAALCKDRICIYRSMGPGRQDPVASSDGTEMRIASGSARFSVDLPDESGVGDAIVYDSNDDGVVDRIAFISRRRSSREVQLQDENGGEVETTTSSMWAIYRAYTSLADAVQGETNPSIPVPFDTWSGGLDLVPGNLVWNIACYADGPEQAEFPNINSWQTTRENVLRIFTPWLPSQVGTSQRHEGVWDPSRFHIARPLEPGIAARDADIYVEGLQISIDSPCGGDLPYGVFSSGGSLHLTASIIRGYTVLTGPDDCAIPRGVAINGGEAFVWNNVVDGFYYGAQTMDTTVNVVFYNNTIINAASASFVHDNGRATLKNNFMLSEGGEDVRVAPGGTTPQPTGSGNRTEDQSASDLGIGAALVSSDTMTYLEGDLDFRLRQGAAELIDQGDDLSQDSVLPFASDFRGADRDGAWDIGANER